MPQSTDIRIGAGQLDSERGPPGARRGGHFGQGTPWDHLVLTRRELLSRCGMGFGALALGQMLGDYASAELGGGNPLAPVARISRPRPNM